MSANAVTPDVNDNAAMLVELAEQLTRYEVTTADDKGGKNIKSLSRTLFANVALPFIDWSECEEQDKGRGPYRTTNQHAFYVKDTVTGDSIQINFSANYLPKDRRGSKQAAKSDAPQLFHLNDGELNALDKFAAELATTDLPQAVRLMTIREVHKAQGGISKDQIKLAWSALEAAGVKG